MANTVEMTYGYSMYGGWYAHNIDMTINLKTDTLRELREICKEYGYELVKREDH